MEVSLPGDLRLLLRRLARSLVYEAPGEEDVCPACGSPYLRDLDLLTLRRVVDGRRTGFVTGCDGCGLVFSNPLPSAEEQARLYSPEGEWEGTPFADPLEGAAPAKPRGRSWSRPFASIRDALDVTSPPRGARVLDFGCGAGTLLDALQDCGWETHGIEPSADAAFRRHGRLTAIPHDATFDLIVAHHVLEHVTNPLQVLQEFAAASPPGAHLLVSVPRLDTLPRHRDYKYVINGHAHVTAYTSPCLWNLMAMSGWEPVAAPPDSVSTGKGGDTSSRLQVMARRHEGAIVRPVSPSASAHASIRAYHAGIPDRPPLERLRLFRLAARLVEHDRRRIITARRAERHALAK